MLWMTDWNDERCGVGLSLQDRLQESHWMHAFWMKRQIIHINLDLERVSDYTHLPNEMLLIISQRRRSLCTYSCIGSWKCFTADRWSACICACTSSHIGIAYHLFCSSYYNVSLTSTDKELMQTELSIGWHCALSQCNDVSTGLGTTAQWQNMTKRTNEASSYTRQKTFQVVAPAYANFIHLCV